MAPTRRGQMATVKLGHVTGGEIWATVRHTAIIVDEPVRFYEFTVLELDVTGQGPSVAFFPKEGSPPVTIRRHPSEVVWIPLEEEAYATSTQDNGGAPEQLLG